MKAIIRFIPVVLICSFLVFSIISCGGGGGGDSAPPATYSSTTVSGSVKLSSAASAKPGVGGRSALSDPVCAPAMEGAYVSLYDADRPDWNSPVAESRTDRLCAYTVTELSNSSLNTKADGSKPYSDNNPIPAGNYTVIATNNISMSGGKYYVAVQPYVMEFKGAVTGNDLVAYDSDTLPRVVSMFGLPANADSSFGSAGTEVSSDAAIPITFNMAMARLSVRDNVSIKEKDNPDAPVTGDWKVSPDLLSATFYPDADLTEGILYKVIVNAAMQNVYGIRLVASVNGYFTTGAVDTTPPNATLYSPDTQTDVPVNSPIQIASNELLDINSMTVTSTPSIGDKPAVMFVGNTSVVPGKPYVYEIVPNSLLTLNTDYSFNVSGATDMAGWELTPLIFNFKTKVVATAPTVTSTGPANLATDVPLNADITAVFSSPMNPSTIDETTFTINNGTSDLAGSVSYDAGTKTATFTPSAALVENAVHTALINTGVADISNVPMSSDKTWTFTTLNPVSDNKAPTVPAGVTATSASVSQIDVSWWASTDNVAVAGYNIYNGVLIGTTDGTSYSYTGLETVTQYCYEVAAYDAAGNESARSPEVCEFTADDTVGDYTDYNYDASGNLTNTVYYSGSGPDGTWFTADDPVGNYSIREYDASDNMTNAVQYGSGPDATWFTADDAMNLYYVYEYDASDNMTKWVRYNGSGPDATWFTSDDSVNAYVPYEYDASGNATNLYYTNGSGPDATWFTADDRVEKYHIYEYDASGILTKQVYYYPGTDGIPHTADDWMGGYFAYKYDASGNATRNVRYHGSSGPDGTWFTADDVVLRYYVYEYDASGNLTKNVQYSGPGANGVWFQ